MYSPKLEQGSLLLLLGSVTIAFVWVVSPFSGAIFWSVVLAILFAPLYRRMLSLMRQRKTLAAAATLLLCVGGAGLPLLLISASLLHQASSVYADLTTRRMDFGVFHQRLVEWLPTWALEGLDRVGLADPSAIQEKLSASAMTASRFIASHVLNVGLDVFGLAADLGVMLYLLFFLLRDGTSLALRVRQAIPIADRDKQALFAMFATVARATVKGGVVMAATQGALGGAMLGLLGVQGPLFWGVVFGLLSMLPAVGAGLLWAPIAVYFVFTGALWKGVTLTFFGVVVLTAVDNILRPILVGNDTQLPGYLILVSTLGGIAVFGLNGVVIGPVIAASFVAAWHLFSRGIPAPGTPSPPTAVDDQLRLLP